MHSSKRVSDDRADRVLFVLAIFAIGESTLFVTSCAIMCISRTHEPSANAMADCSSLKAPIGTS